MTTTGAMPSSWEKLSRWEELSRWSVCRDQGAPASRGIGGRRRTARTRSTLCDVAKYLWRTLRELPGLRRPRTTLPSPFPVWSRAVVMEGGRVCVGV